MSPATIRAWLSRARETFLRSKIAAEQDEEFRFHLEMEIDHHRRHGLSEADARRAAVIAFGGRERFREETRDARGFALVDHVVRDVRFAVRRLRRSPGFTAGAIATLGIGIGAATGIGSIVYGVLVHDLPYENADRLVRVSFVTPGTPGSGDLHSDASYVHLAASARSFDRFGAYYTTDGINISDGDEAERVTAGMVSPGTFRLLGVKPLLGQLFADADTAWGSAIPVLIAQDLWERRYGSDPHIIGRKIEINRGARRVIGVLPRAFDFPTPAVKLWYPLSVSLDRPSLSDRYYTVIAKLKPGVTATAAEAELNALLPALSARFPSITADALQRSGAHVIVQSLKSAMVAPVRGQLVLLGFMVLVVLFISMTNVGSLFLLRAERASPEIAIALSLGATRGAIVRRFVVEGMAAGAASIVVALPVAAATLATKLGFGAREIPRLHEISFSASTIVVVALTALAAGAAIGLFALTRGGGELARLGDRLRGAARATASPAWRAVQRTMVATQIAIALALLVAAGLLGRSFWNLKTAKLGFDPSAATVFEVALPYTGYASYADAVAFHARVTDRLRALPGVSGAVAVMRVPLAARGAPELSLRLEAIGKPRQIVAVAEANMATPDYFRVMSIPLVRGRSFAAGDLRADTPAIVLGASVARSLFGSDDPLGQRVRRDPAPGVRPMTFRVIGVAGDVPGERIEDGAAAMVYFPLLRDGDGLPPDSRPLPFVPRGVQYVVRAVVPPSTGTIRSLIRDVDRRVPAVNIEPLSAIVHAATARVRLTLTLLSVAGGAALLLGVVGVYSVVSYAADGRLREFGVRLALGATPRRVASMVLREGLVVAAAGIVAGLVVASAGTRLLASLLFEVSPRSGAEFMIATGVLAGVTLVAMFVPARRASRTDPASVLRGE